MAAAGACVWLCSCAASTGAGSSAPTAPPTTTQPPLGSGTYTVRVGGHARPFQLVSPRGERPVPLVIALHGAGGDPAGLAAASGLDDAARRYRFAVAFLTGIGRSWNAGECCPPADRDHIDDEGYVGAVATYLVDRGEADRRHVYVVGFSNGGMLAETIGCHAGRVAHGLAVAGIADIAGALMTRPCTPRSSLRVLLLHGAVDPLIGIDGGSGFDQGELITIPSFADTVTRWREALQCGAAEPPDVAPGLETSTSSCADGSLAAYRVTGLGHAWPRQGRSDAIDATATIVSFFGLDR